MWKFSFPLEIHVSIWVEIVGEERECKNCIGVYNKKKLAVVHKTKHFTLGMQR